MIIGWDVSTAAIGICVKEDDGRTVEFGVIYPIGKTHIEKHKNAVNQVTTFCKRLCTGKVTHFVEDRLGGFTSGLTTKQTLMVLAAMNAVVSLALTDFGDVTHLHPGTTKKLSGLVVPKKYADGTKGNKKLEAIKLARSREPTFPYTETAAGNWSRGVDDMADAWLLVEAGGKILRGEAAIGRPKKAPSRKGKARGAKDRTPKEG
jgi:hypothetical protein